MFGKRFHEHEEEIPTVVQYYDSIGILVKVRLMAAAELQWLTFVGRFKRRTRIYIHKAF